MNTFSCIQTRDCELIRLLAGAVWYPTYEGIHSREQLEYMFDRMYQTESLLNQMEEGHLFFIGYDENAPIGYFSIEQKEKDLFYLQKLYVLPDYQGKGAGKFLFQAAVSYAKELHPEPCILELNVNRQNSAICFYERMGMTIVRESDEVIGNGFVMNNCFMNMII